MLVYADNAATAPLSKAALEAMMPFLTKRFGNASSFHRVGFEAKKALEAARASIASLLGAENLVFTGCGTEALNLAITGFARANRKKGKHIIISAIEHHAVLNVAKALRDREGFELTILPVDGDGFVSPGDLRAVIRPETILVSIMTANNEIGTIQPIAELASAARERAVTFHTDAVQAVGHIPVNLNDMGADMITFSAHKFGGPTGVGALAMRKGIRLEPVIIGGGHEKGLRSGTENVAGIVGMAAALEYSVSALGQTATRLAAMRDRLIDGILKIEATRLNGHPACRLPGNVNVSIMGIEGESIILKLNNAGICASSGSACSTASLDPSHVLLAIGLTHVEAHGSLRLSLGEQNTDMDVGYILETLPGIVNELRSMSPLWKK